MWTEREERTWQSIVEWERQIESYQPTDFEMTYEKWLENSLENLNPRLRNKLFNSLDDWLFHTHSFIQGTQIQLDARQRILTESRIFNEDINQLSDLKMLSLDQLNYLSNQQTAKHRVISFTQGALAGTGGILLLGLDIPATLVINLRAVQLVAMSYGYDVNVPSEMMISLKVFHAATLPARIQAVGWQELKKELDNIHQYNYFYEGDERLTDESWLDQPLQQVVKAFAIMAFRKKLIQGLPLVGMAIGAGLNYQLCRRVTDFSKQFYQMRYLMEKKEKLV